ncbi:MAG TPA: hypothetical protein VM261_12590 [Kofleriaceae bacterium]|nr:hypothetical protein [Kofleriaceae bacterium]
MINMRRYSRAGLLLYIAGCKFPDLPEIETDASVDRSVGGTVEGLWTGADLVLRLDVSGREPQRLTVNGEGTFTFADRLLPQTPFALSIETDAAEHECTVETPTGEVVAADVTDLRVRCTSPIAISLSLSALQPFTFDGQLSHQELDASVLLGAVSVTVSGPVGSTFLLGGQPLTPLVPSSPVELVLGKNTLGIDVSVGPLSRRYEIEIDRGAVPPVEYFYAKASNRDAFDGYGSSVAAHGDIVAIGAPGEDSGSSSSPADNSVRESGALYVARPNGVDLAYFKSVPAISNGDFGRSVAINDAYLVVGAPDHVGTTPGVVQVWRRAGLTWTMVPSLAASSAANGDGFGTSVDVYGDTIAVGAPNKPDGGATPSGAVYVFRRTGGWFVEEAVIRAPAGASGGYFGNAISLGEDRLVISAEGDGSAVAGISTTPGTDLGAVHSGAAYVFHRSGTTWTLEAYIKASNPGMDDAFGRSLDLDGALLVVGAPGEASAGNDQQDNSAPLAGAVYVFRRSGTAWTQEAYLKSPAPSAEDLFGESVSARRDTIAVGATENFNLRYDPGSVHVFNYAGSAWGPVARITASNADPGDRFHVVALSESGLVVGAPVESGQQANDNNLEFSGAAYFYR